MKKCPYCAEEIQDQAIICRYCGENLKSIPTDGLIFKVKDERKGFIHGYVITYALAFGLFLVIALSDLGDSRRSSSALEGMVTILSCAIIIGHFALLSINMRFAKVLEISSLGKFIYGILTFGGSLLCFIGLLIAANGKIQEMENHPVYRNSQEA